jgi:sugar lactone lactonase YvrE
LSSARRAGPIQRTGNRLSPSDLVADRVGDVTCALAESPIWCAATRQLLWVDIDGRQLHRHDPQTGTVTSIGLSETITAIARTASGGLVAASRSGFASVDEATGAVAPIAFPLVTHPDDRMNDGACDPHGAFWAGSMVADARAGSGGLWRLSPNGSVDTVLRGITCSNGLDWSPDGSVAYYVDTDARRVDVLEPDADGSGWSRSPLFDVPPVLGLPDGLTVDADGGIWLATWGAGQVRRHEPDGTLDLVVSLHARQVTSCCFGGHDLTTLFVTSARAGLGQQASDGDGGLFAVATAHRGQAPATFGGPAGGA